MTNRRISLKNRTLKSKNKVKRGGFWLELFGLNNSRSSSNPSTMQNVITGKPGDGKLKYNGNSVKCYICNGEKFRFRPGTIGKSKLNNALVDTFLFNDASSDFSNISVNCYFCLTCGNSIIIRDSKYSSNYTNSGNFVKFVESN
jgi:hypothetical protein